MLLGLHATGQFDMAFGGESLIFSCLQLAPRNFFVPARGIVFVHLSVPHPSLRRLQLLFFVPLGSFGAVALRAIGTPAVTAAAELLEMPDPLLSNMGPPRHIPLDAPVMLSMVLVRPLPQNPRWPITASFFFIPPPACRYGITLPVRASTISLPSTIPARAGIMCDSGRKSNADGSSGPDTSPLPDTAMIPGGG